MYANTSLTAAVHDDLVIEEFGRYAAFSQVPQPCIGSGVAQIPVSGTTENARRSA